MRGNVRSKTDPSSATGGTMTTEATYIHIAIVITKNEDWRFVATVVGCVVSLKINWSS
jgi:hypothetical protein